MITTYEAWSSDRPIYSRLPGYRGQYSGNEVADWLTKFWDEFLVLQKEEVDSLLVNDLNPTLCREKFLDYLAFINGFSGKYWDTSWHPIAKRRLIAASHPILWGQMGSKNALSTAIAAFGIKHVILETSDFIVDVSEVGDPIGDLAWSYTIYLPLRYQGTEVVGIVERMNYLWGVGYCQAAIVFDDTKFVEVGLILADEDEVLYVTQPLNLSNRPLVSTSYALAANLGGVIADDDDSSGSFMIVI